MHISSVALSNEISRSIVENLEKFSNLISFNKNLKLIYAKFILSYFIL